MIDRASIERSRVVFEIVETERTHDPRHRRNILDEYRGAGYSSLHLMHRMHLLCHDVLKLDRDLRRDVARDPFKARIAATLLDVANALGIDALAEGIETDGELEWVQLHGATFVQSFLSARPAPTPVTAIASRSPAKSPPDYGSRVSWSSSPKKPPPPSPPLTRSTCSSFEYDVPPTMIVTL